MSEFDDRLAEETRQAAIYKEWRKSGFDESDRIVRDATEDTRSAARQLPRKLWKKRSIGVAPDGTTRLSGMQSRLLRGPRFRQTDTWQAFYVSDNGSDDYGELLRDGRFAGNERELLKDAASAIARGR